MRQAFDAGRKNVNHVIKKAGEGALKDSVRFDSLLSTNTESGILAFILVILVFKQGEAVFPVFRLFAPWFREVCGISGRWFAAISTFANVLILLSSTDMSIK